VEPLQTIVLALVQGITEFLPISSSAHLILVSSWLGWADQGLRFDMAVHTGSLVAIIVYLRADLGRLIRSLGPGVTAQEEPARRLAVLIGVASITVLLLGWLTRDLVEQYGRDPGLIAVCSIVFGVLLWAADRFGRRRSGIDGLAWSTALLIGLAQALALMPGTSRSGVVMTAALALGLGRTAAARFAFLLAVPVLLVMGSVDVVELLLTGGAVADWPALALGFVVSAASAYVAVDALLRWLRRQGMAIFAIYRVALGLIILIPGVL
jgi:undecaprenyl-diphosphatase